MAEPTRPRPSTSASASPMSTSRSSGCSLSRSRRGSRRDSREASSTPRRLTIAESTKLNATASETTTTHWSSSSPVLAPTATTMIPNSEKFPSTSAGEERRAPPQPHHPEHDRVRGDLERQEQQEEQSQADLEQVRRPVQTDLQEERDEHEVLERHERPGQLPRLRMGRQQDTDHERADVAVDSDELEQPVTQHDGDAHAEQGLQLAVADPVPQPVQDPGARDQQEEQERPRARRLTARQRQEDDGRDVLHDQHTDGDPTVERRGVRAVVENLDDEDGRGEREREPDQRERAERLVRQVPEPDHGEQTEEAERDRDAQRDVHERGQPDLAAQQGAHVELEPDREEQQDDTQARDLLEVGQLRGPRSRPARSPRRGTRPAAAGATRRR